MTAKERAIKSDLTARGLRDAFDEVPELDLLQHAVLRNEPPFFRPERLIAATQVARSQSVTGTP